MCYNRLLGSDGKDRGSLICLFILKRLDLIVEACFLLIFTDIVKFWVLKSKSLIYAKTLDKSKKTVTCIYFGVVL